MKEKNEDIKLWILDEMRQKDKENAKNAETSKANQRAAQQKNYCQKCNHPYDQPRIVQYYACPHCMAKIEEETQTKTGCQYYFGFLSQKDKTQSLPTECIECKQVVECMLNQNNSPSVVAEIKKWY
jgi:hypothetical protein